ncbi:transcriptional regulator [Erwinia aphidicola]|uniref:transcriptional regulator n=1 Tax=Erwinia aphidicola TaxID=68334 RepID=UPI00300CBA08
MNNQLLNWRRTSTSSEWLELAKKSGTTVGYLNLVAYGYRNASPRLAMAIEKASETFLKKSPIKKEKLVFPAAPAQEASQ